MNVKAIVFLSACLAVSVSVGQDAIKRETPRIPSPVFTTIKLPSGAVFASTMVKMAENWENLLFPDPSHVYVVNYRSGMVQSVCSNTDGKMDGWVAQLHPNGRLSSLAHYKNSQLDGRQGIWDAETGFRLVYGEFAKDKKVGFMCVFHENRPRVIQEWEKGKMQGEYLILYDPEGKSTVVPLEGCDAQQAAEMSRANAVLIKDRVGLYRGRESPEVEPCR